MTTLSAAVETVWETNVWDHSTIAAITDKVFNYDPTKDSERELTDFYFDQEVNAISYQVNRVQETIGINITQERFTVDVTYFRSKDPDGSNWTEVRDFFETLLYRVHAWSTTWGGTVLYWTAQTTPAEIVEDTLLSEPIWRGRFQFQGFI